LLIVDAVCVVVIVGSYVIPLLAEMLSVDRFFACTKIQYLHPGQGKLGNQPISYGLT
jgi:hypothetical protein